MPGAEASSGGAAGGSQGALLWLGVAVALLALFVAVILATSRRTASRRAVSDPGAAYDPRERELIARLADLDEAFEAGELDEADYVRQRMEIFKELG